MTERRNLKGTWNQALLTFLFPIFLVLAVRWVLVEPFVIPSGSMIPNLLIHDHILVEKFAFGVHWPLSDHWLVRWSQPHRGDIVVFKYPKNPDVYYIKRLIGVPGDVLQIADGRLTVNGQVLPLKDAAHPELEEGFDYFNETNLDGRNYLIRFLRRMRDTQDNLTFTVPPDQYFFMGDNRDQSSDSRYWGFVKSEYIVGKAWAVWLSCDNTLPSMSYVCDPSQIRWSRLFQSVH